MGTRGLTKVIYNDNTVVAQYGQWDHYPSGVGLGIFNFLREHDSIQRLTNSIKKHVYEPSQSEYEAIVLEYSNEEGRMTGEQSEAFSSKYPSLSRDTGGEVLSVIANATEPVPISLSLDFEEDELFCEGVYTVNLDNETFTTKYGGKEFVIPFSEIYNIGAEDYLVGSECGVYQYQKELDIAAVS